MCAWIDCPRAAYDHGVCVTHLIDTYAAGQRAELAPHRRLDAVTAEMRAA